MKVQPNIAIIGAGMAGLAAARELKSAGCYVVIYEKSRAVGGRTASRRHENLVFDHGAQNIKSTDTELGRVAHQLLKPEDFAVIPAPVCLHDGHTILPPGEAANAAPKWSCNGGITRLAKALAADLDIRFNSRVSALGETENDVALYGDGGELITRVDYVIVTAPAPQTADLLAAESPSSTADISARASRIEVLHSITYSNCLSVMLHFDTSLEAHWYALLAQDRAHPLLWLARENAKGTRFVPENSDTSLVAQLGPQISRELYDADDEDVVNQTCVWISELLGEGFAVPQWSSVKRWRYSQPQSTTEFHTVNLPGSRIVICGDATSAGRVPDAYASGLRAADFILQ
ncbi:MAG TPA: FAD-dependent oxidoreductase [Abditibacteriaceae bacterium]